MPFLGSSRSHGPMRSPRKRFDRVRAAPRWQRDRRRGKHQFCPSEWPCFGGVGPTALTHPAHESLSKAARSSSIVQFSSWQSALALKRQRPAAISRCIRLRSLESRCRSSSVRFFISLSSGFCEPGHLGRISLTLFLAHSPSFGAHQYQNVNHDDTS